MKDRAIETLKMLGDQWLDEAKTDPAHWYFWTFTCTQSGKGSIAVTGKLIKLPKDEDAKP